MFTSMRKEYNITILLKGKTDIISDGDRIAINKIHNCAMTVGGTGRHYLA